MTVSCGVCTGIIGENQYVDCNECNTRFHLKCANMNSADVKCLKDKRLLWKCSSCLKAGRRLRSGSASKVALSQPGPGSSGASAQTAGPDKFDSTSAILAELGSIKKMQQEIVSDISSIKESQSKLVEDMNAKYDLLQSSIERCNATLALHSGALDDHQARISSLADRVERIESGVSDFLNSQTLTPSQVSNDGTVLNDMLGEIEERQRRSLNVIVFNIPESSSDVALERMTYDAGIVSGLLGHICGDGLALTDIKVSRVGRRVAGKVRPVRVRLLRKDDVRKILMNSHKSRNAADFGGFVISCDRTPGQQSHYRELKRQLAERIRSGESGLRIKYVSGIPKIVQSN